MKKTFLTMTTSKPNSDILVSVICLTYNHSSFIKQCLDGFVMQETNFNYEVIIHDDASTDDTQDIIKEYAQKYTDIFVPILQKENQYSKHIQIGSTFIYPICRGKYIAYCEGDDYWTDPLKLQRQVDFLEANPDHVAIAENALEVNSVIHKEFPFNTDPSHDVSLDEIILKRRFPTAGVMCRREAIYGFYETCHTTVDTILWCWLVAKGKFRYENIISSVYRRGPQGMTEYTEPYRLARIAETWNLEILRVFDVQKDFMYTHIATAFYNCAKASVKRMHWVSAVKCLYFSLKYILKRR